MKHRVERLCQAFENGSELVDLTDINPHVIANVLKLYMRQLPEPLLTFNYYQDFIRIAETFPAPSPHPPPAAAAKDKADQAAADTGLTPQQEEAVIAELKSLCRKLPRTHLFSLGTYTAMILNHSYRCARFFS